MEWTHKENIKEVKSIRRFTLVHMIIWGGVAGYEFPCPLKGESFYESIRNCETSNFTEYALRGFL